MSALTLIQKATRRLSLPYPNAALTSLDTQILQLVEFANEEGQELAERYPWQALQTETTFTTVAAQSQGALSTIAPNLKYIINDTIWNRNLNRPVFGPLTPQQWQQQIASRFSGPFNEFRIRNGNILFNPIPLAGQTCAFEYVTKNWVTVNAGGSSDGFTNDADTSLLDESIMLLGVIWRWKSAKGLEYAEDFAKYERRVMDAMTRDASKDIITMTGARYNIQPGIIVPSGSWGIQ